MRWVSLQVMPTLNQPQPERLTYIDFHLYFIREFGPPNLSACFGMAPNATTQVIKHNHLTIAGGLRTAKIRPPRLHLDNHGRNARHNQQSIIQATGVYIRVVGHAIPYLCACLAPAARKTARVPCQLNFVARITLHQQPIE